MSQPKDADPAPAPAPNPFVVDTAPGEATVHVLIVGVGRYDGNANLELPGVAAAVCRLRDWWLDCGPRLLGRRTFGSLQVLLAPDGTEETPHALPDLATVRQAVRAWLVKCRAAGPRGMGFLFWVGHGAVQGTSTGANQVLYCTDRIDDELVGEHQAALDWTRTLAAIEGECAEARIYCFIDSCRTPQLVTRHARPAVDAYRPDPSAEAFVMYGAQPGGRSWSIDGEHAGSGFPGGPLMTNAIIHALDRFGATWIDETDGPCSTPEAIYEAVQRRVHRWAVRIAAEDEPDAAPPPIKIRVVPGDWFHDAMLKVSTPGTMLDVIPSEASMVGSHACSIQDAVGDSSDGDSVVDRWHKDVSRGRLTIRVWNPDGGPAIINSVLYADRPHRQLTQLRDTD